MKVQIEWTEEVSYETVIEVDEVEVRKWLTMDAGGVYHPELEQPNVPVTSAETLEYLRNGEEDAWFDQCDSARDFKAVYDRHLDEAQPVD